MSSAPFTVQAWLSLITAAASLPTGIYFLYLTRRTPIPSESNLRRLKLGGWSSLVAGVFMLIRALYFND